MYIKTNPFDRYISDDHLYHLNDGNNEYQIRKNKGLTEIFEYYSSDINTENTNILPLGAHGHKINEAWLLIVFGLHYLHRNY